MRRACPAIALGFEKLCQFTVHLQRKSRFFVNEINHSAPQETGCESCRPASFKLSRSRDESRKMARIIAEWRHFVPTVPGELGICSS
jgi:hypothetical protein